MMQYKQHRLVDIAACRHAFDMSVNACDTSLIMCVDARREVYM